MVFSQLPPHMCGADRKSLLRSSTVRLFNSVYKVSAVWGTSRVLLSHSSTLVDARWVMLFSAGAAEALGSAVALAPVQRVNGLYVLSHPDACGLAETDTVGVVSCGVGAMGEDALVPHQFHLEAAGLFGLSVARVVSSRAGPVWPLGAKPAAVLARVSRLFALASQPVLEVEVVMIVHGHCWRGVIVQQQDAGTSGERRNRWPWSSVFHSGRSFLLQAQRI